MKKTEYKLMDSSAWLSYFFATSTLIKRIVESETVLYTSVISFFEIKRKLLRDGFNKNFKDVQGFIKSRSIIINLDEAISLHAADISFSHKLHALDALIYSTAEAMNAQLVTADSDFESLDDVIIIRKDDNK